jgi:hypothetical protein
LGGADERGERLQPGEVVAVHEDAFGLSDDVAASQCSVKVGFGRGADERHGGVLGEHFPDADRIVIESPGLTAVKVERTQTFAAHEQPERKETARTALYCCLGLTLDGGHLTGRTAGPAGRMSVCRASARSTLPSFGSRLPAW